MTNADILNELGSLSDLLVSEPIPDFDPNVDTFAPRPLPIEPWVPVRLALDSIRLRCFFDKVLENGSKKVAGASIEDFLNSPALQGKTAQERVAFMKEVNFKPFCEVRLLAKVETPGKAGDGAIARGDFSSLRDRRTNAASPLEAILYRMGHDVRNLDYAGLARLAEAVLPTDLEKSTVTGSGNMVWEWQFPNPADAQKTVTKYGYRLGRQVKAADGSIMYLPITTDPQSGSEVRAYLTMSAYKVI